MFTLVNKNNKKDAQKKTQNVSETTQKAPKTVKSITVIDKIPDCIICEYCEDYDICGLHEIILTKLSREREALPKLEKDLESLIDKVDGEYYQNEYKDLLDRIDTLQTEIILLKKNVKTKEYNKKVHGVIARYRAQSSTSVLLAKGGSVDPKSKNKEKLQIIEEYFDIAKSYIKLDIIKNNKTNNKLCKGCNMEIDKYYYINSFGMNVCNICNNQEHYECNESKTVNNTSQCSECEGLENYLKSLDKMQCLQNIIIPEKLYQDLDRYLTKLEPPMQPGAYYRSLPYNKDGRKDGTSHKTLYAALEKTGYAEYYEDAELIGFNYWGWKQRDLSAYIPTLIYRYKRQQPVFDKMPDKMRTSNINLEYRKFKELVAVGYRCYHYEFKLPEDISELERIYKIMCNECGDPDIRFVATIFDQNHG